MTEGKILDVHVHEADHDRHYADTKYGGRCIPLSLKNLHYRAPKTQFNKVIVVSFLKHVFWGITRITLVW